MNAATEELQRLKAMFLLGFRTGARQASRLKVARMDSDELAAANAAWGRYIMRNDPHFEDDDL